MGVLERRATVASALERSIVRVGLEKRPRYVSVKNTKRTSLRHALRRRHMLRPLKYTRLKFAMILRRKRTETRPTLNTSREIARTSTSASGPTVGHSSHAVHPVSKSNGLATVARLSRVLVRSLGRERTRPIRTLGYGVLRSRVTARVRWTHRGDSSDAVPPYSRKSNGIFNGRRLLRRGADSRFALCPRQRVLRGVHVSRPLPVRFGLWTVQTTRTARGFSEH